MLFLKLEDIYSNTNNIDQVWNQIQYVKYDCYESGSRQPALPFSRRIPMMTAMNLLSTVCIYSLESTILIT